MAEMTETKIRLDPDDGVAIAWLFQRITKLQADRVMTAGAIREIMDEAKADGYAAETMSLAVKLNGMTAAERAEWSRRIEPAGALFGIAAPVVGGTPSGSNSLWSYLNRLVVLRDDKKTISAEIKDLYDAAKDRGIDVAALKAVIRLSKLDEDDREQRFHAIDRLGTFLKFW